VYDLLSTHYVEDMMSVRGVFTTADEAMKAERDLHERHPSVRTRVRECPLNPESI
jgi:hypothetical protein